MPKKKSEPAFPKCITCQTEHDPEQHLVTLPPEDAHEQRIAGRAKWPPPPVDPSGWTDINWVQWIHSHGSWA